MLETNVFASAPFRLPSAALDQPIVADIALGERTFVNAVSTDLLVAVERSAMFVGVEVLCGAEVLQADDVVAAHDGSGARWGLVLVGRLDEPVGICVTGRVEAGYRLLARARAVGDLVRVEAVARRDVDELDCGTVGDNGNFDVEVV